MAVIAQAPLTIDEFSRLPRDGARHELSAGELITMPPPKFLHSRIVTTLFKLLLAALGMLVTAKLSLKLVMSCRAIRSQFGSRTFPS